MAGVMAVGQPSIKKIQHAPLGCDRAWSRVNGARLLLLLRGSSLLPVMTAIGHGQGLAQEDQMRHSGRGVSIGA